MLLDIQTPVEKNWLYLIIYKTKNMQTNICHCGYTDETIIITTLNISNNIGK